MADVQIHFLDPMIEFYGSAKAFPPGIVRKLQTYGTNLNEEALRAAADRMTTDHSRPPNLKAMMKALSQAETVSAIGASGLPLYSKYYKQQQEALEYAARKKAIVICRCDLGRRADREGWLVALFDYALEYGRLPDERDQQKCRRKAERSNEAVMRHNGLPTFKKTVESRVAFLDGKSREIFGAEAIQHDLPGAEHPNEDMRGVRLSGQRREAGTGYVERVRAEATLEQMANNRDYGTPSLSALALNAIGITPPKPPEPDEENPWHTEEPS